MAVDQHYENFPVASLLVPSAIRAHVIAIYRFARHADDVADEGDAPPATRQATLDALAADVKALFAGGSEAAINAPTVQALATLRDARLPGVSAAPFLDLLSAFRQDTATTRYHTYADLLDYCRRSANPVGRLMLALVGVQRPDALLASDRICTSLQLINFWQDAALDAARGRIYVPLEAFDAHHVTTERFPQHPLHRDLMAEQCRRAREMMVAGSVLLADLRGRFLLEIAFTVAGGLRILEKIASNDHDVRARPVLRWYDAPRLALLAFRAWRHSRSQRS